MSKILKKSMILYIFLIISYLFIKLKYIGLGEEYSTLEFLTLLSATLIPLFIFSNYEITPIVVPISYLISFFININNKIIWLVSYASIIIIVMLIERLLRKKNG